MKCECLNDRYEPNQKSIRCLNEAVARFTAPRLKPRFFICQEHLDRQLAWAKPYRQQAGRVIVEPLKD